MPRSGAEARGRLQRAALELYRERGFDNTTTAQIAERAGVTERTYFRHFADKREVLFDGEAALRADFERGIAEAPASSDPVSMVFEALRTAIPLLEGNRSFALPRNDVVNATPALRERALAKEAALIDALANALQRRNVDPVQASLAAHVGMAAFGQVMLAWFDDPDTGIDARLTRAQDEVRTLTRTPKSRR